MEKVIESRLKFELFLTIYTSIAAIYVDRHADTIDYVKHVYHDERRSQVDGGGQGSASNARTRLG